MTTSPISTRKPVVRTAARKAVARKPAVKAVAVKPAVKASVRRAVSAAKKPVKALVQKSLKPVVAKSAVLSTKALSVAVEPAKPKKVKLVRDSFTFPAHEHALLADMKKRAEKLGKEFKKTEILRAGIAHLVAMTDSVLLAALAKVERVKTGRPAKKSKKK